MRLSVGMPIRLHIQRLPLVFLHFFYNLVEKIVEELMGVLMHGRAKKFIELLQLVDERSRSDGPSISGIATDVDVERTESTEQRRRCRRNRQASGRGARARACRRRCI